MPKLRKDDQKSEDLTIDNPHNRQFYLSIKIKIGKLVFIILVIIFAIGLYDNFAEIIQTEEKNGNEFITCLSGYDNLNCHGKSQDQSCKKLLNCVMTEQREDVASFDDRMIKAVMQTFGESNTIIGPLVALGIIVFFWK